ncbi:NADH-quinone oxidoreductase subunit M [Bacillus suaedaesalsae]|uniref:NADH-quinone oxidoreductase subunit M n=1 Tax=Bacillus suaedaesalsae TaxID=2810349 RepID=A0ABS2DE47_9BACI|nr:NADH-quinone oxidoreductase subunit M [Bacillus suaedaesalsae]MBM6616732.1 NADH-quinone oxidoreductase subunit M [Bacillus suaedaesalsae]
MNQSILLSLLIFSPVLGILLLAFIPKAQEKTIKLVGFLSTLLPLAVSMIIYIQYLLGKKLSSFAERYEWIQIGNFEEIIRDRVFAIDYELGIDGFALVLLLLTTVIATLASIASIHIKKEWKGYFMLFLLLELGMLGVFAAQNLILFFIFFELTLIPMFFLIGKWGYFEREKAAYSYLIYNGLGSAVLLIVIIVLFARTGTTNIALLSDFISGNVPPEKILLPITPEIRWGLFIGLLVAFGVKLPIFPLHSWMLKVHVQAPPSVVMLHSGILLKIGAFGLIRFGAGLFPEEFVKISVVLAVLGVINLLYGAFLAFIQDDFKMVLAYSSISHMGIVLIGLAALNEAGIQGAIFQVVSHGLISALLFFLVGVMYERTNTTILGNLGGLSKVMPLTAGFFLAGAMASLGLPGMSGFVSEFMAFLGLFKEMPIIAAIGTIGIIMTAVYLLRAVLSMTFGPLNEKMTEVTDMKKVELVPVLVLVGLIVLIGVYPDVLTGPLKSTVEAMMLGIGG